MNITLSADEKLIAKSRDYARSHNTSLNNLIRDYLRSLVNEKDIDETVREFTDLALNQGGASSDHFQFDRNNIYNRSERFSGSQ